MPVDGTFYRRLAITAAALAAYRFGAHLPLPGLDAERVAQVMAHTPGSADRLSILALGVMPLLSALLLIEGAKLIFPGVLRWELAAPHNRARMGHIGIGLALFFALVQATGFAFALEKVPGLVTEPGFPSRAVCIATLVAGTALVIALAEVIDRRGLGAGLWLLFLTPALAELPYLVAELAFIHASGLYPTSALLLSAAFTALAVAAIAALVLASRAAPATTATCVWTPLIANSTVATLLLAVGMLFTSDANEAVAIAAPGHPAWYVAMAIAIGVIVWLYARAYAYADVPGPLPAVAVATVLGGVLIAGAILQYGFRVALPLAGAQLIIAATVATVLLIKWGSIGGRA